MAVLLLCSPLVVGVATAADASPEDVEVDHRQMHVEIDDSGDAHWTIEYRMLLEDENQTQRYEAVRADIAENPDAYEEHFSIYMNAVFVEATEHVDRYMSLTNRTVDTREIRNTYGVVQYEFTWENFAAVSETNSTRTITAGESISHLRIGSDTRLTVTIPNEYDIQTVSPLSDDAHLRNQITWTGPIEFTGDDSPRIVIDRPVDTDPVPIDDPTPTDTGENNSTATPPTSPAEPPEEQGIDAQIAIGIIGLVSVVSTILYYRRDGDDGAEDSDDERGPETIAEVSETTETETDIANDPTESEGEPDKMEDNPISTEDTRVEEGLDEEEDNEGESEETDVSESDVDFDLMSNEEQIFHLLDEHDGRIKQQDIVEETGWSAAKTSNVVNDMKDTGDIEVFRLGRENIVSRPDPDEGDDGRASS